VIVFILFLRYRSANGRTSFHEAACKGNVELGSFLIKKGARVNITDDDGETPLHFAAYKGHHDCVAFLLSRGANVNNTNKCMQTPLHKAAIDLRKGKWFTQNNIRRI